MRNNTLNNQMFANISINLFDNMNLQAAADDFVKPSKTRLNYFGLWSH